MAGIKRARFCQLGAEATAGVEVNADILWLGTSTMLEDRRGIQFHEMDRGLYAPSEEMYTSHQLGAITLNGVATYEQLPHIFEMGIRTDAPAADGAGTGYIYEYILPTTQTNTIKTYTVEAGDNQQEEQMLYGFCEHFTLTGAPRGAVMVSADLLGREVAPDTKTGALSPPTVHDEILFGNAYLYIDTPGSTFGATTKSNTLLGFELDFVTGWIPKFTGDGQIYFTFPANVGPDIKLTVTFEHDATAVAEVAKWRAETGFLTRIKCLGPQLTTAGAYTNKTLIIDLAGKWESFEVIGEIDGNDIRRGVLHARYNETADDYGKLIVVNELAALP